jgi:LysR family transcriptional regulator, flagellar master operon regulator
MDTDLLKTFLEVNRTRHFGRAAEILCLTPSAVSARIRLLEDQLGVPLFTRERNNIGLTAAGERLLAHAGNLLRALEKARLDVALGGDHPQLAIAATPGVWDNLALQWAAALWADTTSPALRLEEMTPSGVRDALERGLIDLGLLLDAPGASGIASRTVAQLTLRLFSNVPGETLDQVLAAEHYILVDWGSAFLAQHAYWFPPASNPRARVSTERLALALLHSAPGAAYLADHAAATLADDRLHAVEQAPPMILPVHACWREDNHLAETIGWVLDRIPAQ